ncbi:MAG TPA: PQQ-dependent sugar dehydrogenase, partial [Promineifilum sp.]|nr:PQQ-dependent sugar dehydrogenase [Promineifilum sp.]
MSRTSGAALLVVVAAAFLGIVVAAARPAPAAAVFAPELAPFAAGLTRPVHVVHSGLPGDGRLFAVEQPGRIRIVTAGGTVLSRPFLDIGDRVDNSNRAFGLRGVAFDPDYAANGYFYVNYLAYDGQTRRVIIARYRVSAADPDEAMKNSETILLAAPLPGDQHHAGDLAFGPDGYLYVPMGDGHDNQSTTDDPQRPDRLVGKMVRIDVSPATGNGLPPDCPGAGGGGYTVPADNPFIDAPGACDEIWAMGLRNPWRFSFDPATGDLWLPDPGRERWDEINYRPAGQGGGDNFGWPCYEGEATFLTAGCGPAAEFTFPAVVLAIGAGGRCSIIGGHVYRGAAVPALVGRYVAADYCTGDLLVMSPAGGGTWNLTWHPAVAAFGVVAFGVDGAGELYAVNREEGAIYRLVGGGEPATATPTPTRTPS